MTDKSHHRSVEGTSSESGIAEYIYKPLRKGNHIRTLQLLPGAGEICCELSVIPLKHAAGCYEAISYAWGEASKTVNIKCDEKLFSVTVNLADALWTIRHPTEPRILWADAICINQHDKKEQGHQVMMMGKIYEQANRVLIYLGNDDEEIAEDCFKLIRETNEYFDKQFEIYGCTSQNDLHKIPRIVPNGPICSDKTRWSKVNKLVDLPWFTRVWVLQEVGLAATAVLLWGSQGLNFSEIVELALWVLWRPDISAIAGIVNTGRLFDNFVGIWKTYGNTKSWREEMPFIRSQSVVNYYDSFLLVLHMARIYEASDPRDKIYAFLGHPLALNSDGSGTTISADYTKNVKDVYFETASVFLNQKKDAPFVLSCVQYDSLVDLGDGDVPSWVPLWDRGRWIRTLGVPWLWYQAGGSTSVFQACIQDDKSLAIRGVVFDEVRWVSKRMYQRDFEIPTAAASADGKHFVESLWEEVSQFTIDPANMSSAKRRDNFSLTLVAGFTGENPAEDDISQHRANFLAHRHAREFEDATADGKELDETSESIENGDHAQFYDDCGFFCDNRIFICTKAGRFGLAPWLAQPGYLCCVFPGAKVPFILRAMEETSGYKLIGESYIHGIMRGEAIEMAKEGKFKEDIVLV